MPIGVGRRQASVATATDPYVGLTRRHGRRRRRGFSNLARVALISFARGVPTADAIAIDAIRAAAGRALADDEAAARVLSYGPGGGWPALRAALAARHDVAVERILVVNGSLQGVAFVAEHFARTGRARVALEAPTYDRSLLNFRDRAFAIHSVLLADDGLDVDALERAVDAGAALLYTIPTFQNPAGCTLSAAKRERVAALARERDLWIFEDDPYSLLRYRGEDVPTIHSLAPDRTIWSTSFTKTVAPGLRVGYLVLPEALVAELTRIAVNTYISPSFLPEAIVTDLLASGSFEAGVALARGLLAERLAAMCAALDEHLPDARYVRPDGGYFLWLDLPDGVTATAVMAAATTHDVALVPGTDFFVDGGDGSVRLAFSGVVAGEIAEGVRRLAAAVADSRV